MEASEPEVTQLPEAFPVFPLPGALLLPQGKLPLNIFEKRYLALVEDALGAGRMFGMIQPNPVLAPGESGPALYSVGCLGRLTSFSETDDGRFLITLSGLSRFTVAEELPMRRGYRRVRADYAAFRADLEGEPEVELAREKLFAALRGYFGRRGFEANWDAIEQMPDDMLLVTLCMACPFENAEKQALLEASTQHDRAQALLALLLMDQHSEDQPPQSSRLDS